MRLVHPLRRGLPARRRRRALGTDSDTDFETDNSRRSLQKGVPGRQALKTLCPDIGCVNLEEGTHPPQFIPTLPSLRPSTRPGTAIERNVPSSPSLAFGIPS